MPLLIMPNLATMKPAPTNNFRWAPLPYGMDGWMDGYIHAWMDGKHFLMVFMSHN